MFKNLLNHSLRALNRQKSYVFLNIIGLSVGIACSLLISLFLINELSYDRFHEKKDRIYRVILDGKIGEQEVKAPYTCSPLGNTLLNEIPEVEAFCRLNGWDEIIIKYYDQSFTEDAFIESDSSFFEIFSVHLIKGDKRNVLNEPHTLVISETTASRIFGKTDPQDKMLKIGMDTVLYRVTGVMRDLPKNSQFRVNMIASFMTNPMVKDSTINGRLRSLLVILQFSISITLIVGTLIMFRQINYMLNRDLGFDKEQLMIISRAETVENHVIAFKEEILKIKGVVSVTSSTSIPGHNDNNNGYMMKGRLEETFLMWTNWVDYDYFKTYRIKINTGRNFNQELSTDQDACVINSSAVRQFGINEPLAAIFMAPGDSGRSTDMQVLGVAEDFNFESLHSAISPYVFRFKNENNNYGYFSIRLDPSFNEETLKSIETVWKNFTNSDPMKYFFMDEDFNRMYSQEKQSSSLALLFAVLAVIIASLGLFGLTSYSVQQRTKEIGIRKTMGASTMEIIILISRDILILVSVATLIAWPLIYYIASKWLQNFYYRIDLRAWDFAIGFLIALVIAMATISYQTIRTARINPAFSLRYE